MSMSSHQKAVGASDTWLTPPEIIKALGPFDLDPCCPPNMPWVTASRFYTERDVCSVCLPDAEGRPSGFMSTGAEIDECRFCDGLAQPWSGRVWLNPPFNRYVVPRWMRRMAEHGNGIALLAARTETKVFFESVWPCARAILFLRGRPHFYHLDGTRADNNSGAPICLVAYGDNVCALAQSDLGGKLIYLR